LPQIAVKVATRVKSHRPDRNQLLVDAGFLAMSWDGFSAFDKELDGSFCKVEGDDNLRQVNPKLE
jgi:D-serine deaminase-like pyridoxal phosphate-dependent protein